MSTFDIKKFLINEGMTRVSRDRKRLLKEDKDMFFSQEGYQLAKDILSGKIDGHVALFGRNGQDKKMLPGGWNQNVWNDYVLDPEDVPDRDCIFAIPEGEEEEWVFRYEYGYDGPEDKLYEIWDELKRISKESDAGDEEEIHEGTKVTLRGGKVSSIDGEAPDRNEETAFTEGILSVEDLNVEDGLYYVLHYDDTYLIHRDPDIITTSNDEYWGKQDYYWYREDDNLSEY